MPPEIKIKKDFSVPLKNHYVYLHVKEDDGEVFYVGKGVRYRWCISSSRKTHWKNVARKHGVICKIAANNLTADEALILEKKLIAAYGRLDQGTGCLVNLTDGGDGIVNYVWTDEHKRKISEAHIGKRHTEEFKQMLSALYSGRTLSEETKAKISKARSGIPMTQKQREAFDNRINPLSRKILCIQTGIVYDSLTDAAKAVGLTATEVSKVCKGKRKSRKGFSWKYFDDQISPENAA